MHKALTVQLNAIVAKFNPNSPLLLCWNLTARPCPCALETVLAVLKYAYKDKRSRYSTTARDYANRQQTGVLQHTHAKIPWPQRLKKLKRQSVRAAYLHHL